MPTTRRQYLGNATATTTTSTFNIGATTVTLTAATNWPSGAVPFYVAVEPDVVANVEKFLATRSGLTLTSVSRGQDGTTEKNHASGVNIYPVATATDFDEANLALSSPVAIFPLASASNVIVDAGYSGYVAGPYEVLDGIILEIASGALLEIG